MNLTREQTIEALEYCSNKQTFCNDCLLSDETECDLILNRNALRHLKENEPAPSANDTSSNENNLHFDSTTISENCQEAIDTTSCTGEVIAGLKFMYPNATVRGTMTNEDRCCVDFKYGDKNYSLYLEHDTYADNQETDNGR